MAISRRQIFQFAQAWVAAAAVPRHIFAGAAPDSALAMPMKSFEPLVGTTFTADATSLKPSWLTLSRVEDLTLRGAVVQTGKTSIATPIPTETFALHFTAAGAALRQGTYAFDHLTLGKVSLFVVPNGAGYVAVINHLLGPLPPGYAIPKPAAPKAA